MNYSTTTDTSKLSQSSIADDVALEDLLRVTESLPLHGEVVALDQSQRSYLVAAARKYGVRRTWTALIRAVQTGDYGPQEVVRVTWAILKRQTEQPAVC